MKTELTSDNVITPEMLEDMFLRVSAYDTIRSEMCMHPRDYVNLLNMNSPLPCVSDELFDPAIQY